MTDYLAFWRASDINSHLNPPISDIIMFCFSENSRRKPAPSLQTWSLLRIFSSFYYTVGVVEVSLLTRFNFFLRTGLVFVSPSSWPTNHILLAVWVLSSLSLPQFCTFFTFVQVGGQRVISLPVAPSSILFVSLCFALLERQ